MSQHYTSVTGERKKVTVDSNQKKYWVEFQLLDELGAPVTHMPYRAVNDATRSKHIKEYTGQSDASGIIRIEDLHCLDLTLLISAQPLADEMENRKLRIKRGEKNSQVKKNAQQEGYEYRYVRIGELCDQLPNITPEWHDKKHPPKYHFPDPAFPGLTVEKLNCRHVLEVCPFRAWSPWLKHTKEYNLINAYNLSLMAVLVYADDEENEERIAHGSIKDFFFNQLLSLEQLPNKVNNQYFPLAAHDVPFSQRYNQVRFIDTSKIDLGESDSQMFYASSPTEAIVSWRGTAGLDDVCTDANGFSVDASDIEGLSGGNVHNGFKNAFIATELSSDRSKNFTAFNTAIKGKKIYLCGHSLGGALALIHSAYVNINMSRDIILYTYGMPRVFTYSMTQTLNFPHYRHVNNRDTITAVPWPDLGRIYYTELIKLDPLMELFDRGVKPLSYSHHGHLVHFKSLNFELYVKGRPATKSWVGQELKVMLPLSLTGGVDNAKIHQKILDLYQTEGQDNPTDFKGVPADHSSANYAGFIYTRLTALICEKSGDQDNPWLQQRAKADSYQPFYGGEASWRPLLIWDESLVKHQTTLLGTEDGYQTAEQLLMTWYYDVEIPNQLKQHLSRDLAESKKALLEKKQKYANTYASAEKQVRTIYNSTNTIEVPVGVGKKALDNLSGDIKTLESNIGRLQGML
jgi:esterase/lipase